MTRAYIGAGANLGDPMAIIVRAIGGLARVSGVEVLRSASRYRSAPIGVEDQPDFVNTVVEISTSLSPSHLLAELKALERELGRTPGVRWGPRVIDLDVLLYDDQRLDTPELTVPHREMWHRLFVLAPLAELRPDLQGPDGRTINEYRDALGASQRVERLDETGAR